MALVSALALVPACLGVGEGPAPAPSGAFGAPATPLGRPIGGACYVARRSHPTPGPPPAPLVVLAASWLEQDFPDLPGETYFVDLPGRGQAAPVDPDGAESARLEDDLLDLEALRQQLGLERLVLCGWSYYGGLAVQYALRHPDHVAGLVLIAPLPPRRTPHWKRFVDRIRPRTDPAALERIETLRRGGGKRRQPYDFCREFTRLFLETRTHDPAAALERMRSEPCVRPNLDPDLSAVLGQAIVAGLGDWDWRPDLSALDLPVLIVHGEEDAYPVAGSEEYVEAIAGAELVVLPNTGHLPWLESPGAFDEAIRLTHRSPIAPVQD